MHPLYSIPMFVTSLATASFGLFVFLKRPAVNLNRLFCLLSCSVAWWAFGYGMLFRASEPDQALVWARFGYFGVVFIPTAFYHFILTFLQMPRRKLVPVLYAVSGLFVILSRFDFFLTRPYIYFWGYYPKAGSLYWTFIVFFYGILAQSVFVLFRAYSQLKAEPAHGPSMVQVRYVLWAYVVAMFSVSDFLPNYGWEVYPFAYLAATGWLGLMAYAIFKYRLMDIDMILRKTLIYSLVTVVITGVYMAPIVVITHVYERMSGNSQLWGALMAAALTTLVFHPLRMKIQRFVDRIFFREALDQALLREATSGFVHEIKRPLANISLPAELALRDLQDLMDKRRTSKEILPKILQRLQYIIDQTADAGNKIEAIREFSHSNGKALVEVNLAEIIRKSLSVEDSLLRRHAVQIQLDIAAELPTIQGHPKQLEIVLTNLIKNAAEALAGDKSATAKRISIIAQRSEGGIVVTVKDSGPGIPAEIRARLFEPYFTTKGAHGTGMGLYLCRQIIQAHGGTIEVESERNRGTTFKINISRSAHGTIT